MPRAATQVYTKDFDAVLARLPSNVASVIGDRIDDLGRRLDTFPHYRMTGEPRFRLRVGDYRVIYRLDTARNELYLIALGNRREVYR